MEEEKKCPEGEAEIRSARIGDEGPIVHFSLPGLAHITPRMFVFQSPFDARGVVLNDSDIPEEPRDNKKTREEKRNRKWKYMETTRKCK